MVMDYVEGQTLADYIRTTSARGLPPAPSDIVNLFTSLSLAVDYAHQKGMIHRDIKPANILLDKRNTIFNTSEMWQKADTMGEPILTDFGVAKLLGMTASATSATQMGTALYISPEQAQGLPGNALSDIYSLGVILYEIVTGVTPFPRNTSVAVITQHITSTLPSPALINPRVPPALTSVILVCLAKDPEARFQSASAMTNALAQALYVPVPTEVPEVRQRFPSTDSLPKVFFSYAHKDKGLRDRLEDHLSNLKYRGLISTWHDREISAGEEWAHQIDIHLATAHIILLLISASFMASKYCYSIEMGRALERHKRGETRVIPVLLRPVLFTDAPFAKLQMFPTNGKPVVNWRNRDSAFVDIALGIERIVQERLAPVRTPPFSSEQPYQPSLPLPRIQPPSLSTLPCAPAPHPSPIRGSSRSLILVGLSLLGLLSAGVLLVSHPNFIPFVGGIVGSLVFLAGLLLALRAPLKRAQSRAVRRREQEQAQRQLEAARRREQEEARRREEEARRREREEARRSEQERAYYEEALAAYEQALRQNNADAIAYRGKGEALFGLERFDEALIAFEQAVVLTPLPTAYVSLGNVLSKLKRSSEAIAAYEQAIESDPEFVPAYYGMGGALEQLGRTQEAGLIRERAKQLGYEE
jgi:serine/threonine protein kinase/Tfp pilus assembly protein PilF